MSASRGRSSLRPRGRGRGRGRGGPNPLHQGENQATKMADRSVVTRVDQDQEVNWEIAERFRKGKSHRMQGKRDDLFPTERSSLDITLNKDIRKYIQEQEDIKSKNEKERWLDAPEIPTSTELHLSNDAVVNLLPNKIHDKFKTLRGYLKTHYQLLREDATSPLREAIDKFRKNPDMDDDNDTSIYEKVHISGFTFTHMGVAARIKFSTRRAGRRIMWSASKRLTSGSLIALASATDNFDSQCIVATVAARPLELLERSPPEIDIYFSCSEEIQIDPQAEFVMLEARTGYYEAYRHTLKAIQKMSREGFSLSPHITGAATDVGPPQYLANWPNRTLCAALSDRESSPSFSSVDIVSEWPERPADTTLDISQWAALRQILTRKLAIVQGPPGTGKTHVSKVALQILMENRKVDDPPIIIAAQTNHALDQLLKHVSQFDPQYVRLGGRSTNPEVKKRALFEIRQRERIPNIPGSMFGPAKKKLEAEETKYGELLTIYGDGYDPISCDKLSDLGVINSAQKQSLLDAVKNLITANEEDRNPILYWLHKALIPFEVKYGDDDFGFEHAEEDLEFEQLREFEAEHGVADEEDLEMLKGPFIPVFDKIAVVSPSANDLEKAKKMLDTKQDLWKIPEYLRGPAYHVMKQRVKALILAKFREQTEIYNKTIRELRIGKWEKDAVFLKRANIIGMTTTGLSKYRPLISSLQPRIILIEEAAEVIEGPVTAACMESVEHLILVGDHQQLQGHCSVSELENEPYYLNISMFERLVNVGMPFQTLLRQRRMEPEFRELISSIYPGLKDHEDVLSRVPRPPWGTGTFRSFFFDHKGAEHRDESLSIYNEIEALMVVKFYRHLLRHGIPAAGVTILTLYNGQRKRILRELKRDPETSSTYNLVKTVDSYQGEENEIVILSLVRSNSDRKIGFLENDNRVCVALSRARRGFYLFGDAALLSERSSLWSRVVRLMTESEPARLGQKLPLACINHNRDISVQWPRDFDGFDGGCDITCGEHRSCGHIYLRKCHPMPHDSSLACLERCDRRLVCGHICTERCGQSCKCDCSDYDAFTQWNTRTVNQYASVVNRNATPAGSRTNVNDDSRQVNLIDLDLEEDSAADVKNILTGRPLARGGAAFQPQFVPPGASSQGERAKTGQEPKDTATVEGQAHAARNLLLEDVVSSGDMSGWVQSSTEKSIGHGRSKFTDYFQPAMPKGTHVTRNKEDFENKNVANNGLDLLD